MTWTQAFLKAIWVVLVIVAIVIAFAFLMLFLAHLIQLYGVWVFYGFLVLTLLVIGTFSFKYHGN
jgi:multidrug transporter EmrE-like cation transporter